jgi:hypothetical protein
MVQRESILAKIGLSNFMNAFLIIQALNWPHHPVIKAVEILLG